MAENSKIQWTDHTFNPWRGCTKVSPGCTNCYADTMSKRNPGTLGVWGKYGTRVVASESMWKQPLKWNREAEASGIRRKVFCASLADVFEGIETMPDSAIQDVFRARVRLFQLIQDTPALDWLLLTKRPENIDPILDGMGIYGTISKIMPNVWIGTTVENQEMADKRIPELLKIPAKVRFLSVEPMLEEICLARWMNRFSDGKKVFPNVAEPDWVIVGGESGGNKRPFDPDWARTIRDQCTSAGTAFFMKQIDKIQPIPDDLMIRQFPGENQ